MKKQLTSFWSLSAAELLQELQTSPQGLTSAEAQERLGRYGLNRLKAKSRTDWLALFLAQFKSPIILILLFAAGLSLFLRDAPDAFIIISIVLVSGLLGFWQERGATDAVEKLLAIVQVRAAVLRDGKETEIPVEEVVPGDIAILNAGDMVPGDCAILESKDLFVNEAALTGETFPVEKQPGTLPSEISPWRADQCSLYGHPRGQRHGEALIVRTGTWIPNSGRCQLAEDCGRPRPNSNAGCGALATC